ncbi:MAG: DUF3488 and transglutaminase-like domain-containing protein [Fimbriimonadaceae bacterium]|nr:DUF4129 domain-containing protein [Chthonomonadaceae bacterium]MCO5296864.1 DUF3488 and transglutaminase-like domain-containing protein [Fimbriimonadaceae bacterium]
MRGPRLVRKIERLGWLDFVLAGSAASATVYSAGQGLSEPAIGTVLVVLVLVGTAISLAINRFFQIEKLGPFAALPYAASLIAATFFAPELNRFLPGEGFPLELMLGGVLCWMIVAGSFTAWRDGTLLFQVVPGIAMFGMVGTWDTFKEAPVAFFGFLLCVAALFARAHGRAMLEQASAAGFFEEGVGIDERSMRRIQAGPWRWMAGPEWALASAAVVVLVSLLGAPILQESVKGVSTIVNLSVPRPKNAANPSNFRTSRAGTVEVGRGPLALNADVVLRARLDQQRYLRSEIFDTYAGRGWSATPRPFESGASRAVADIAQPKRIRFGIELVSGSHVDVPVPGVVTSISGMRRARIRADGTVELERPVSMTPELVGRAIVPANEGAVPPNARAGLPSEEFGGSYLAIGNVPSAVFEFAQETVAGKSSDYEKAQAIKKMLEERCVYNLNAPALPPDVDAVSAFLFDQPEGYCDLFASAMAVLARCAGIPSRYVVGYYPFGETVDEEGRYNVRESDAHAWAELYFEGVGWIPFDATEGARVAEGSERGGAVAAPWFETPLGIGALIAAAGGLGFGVWRLRGRAGAALRPSREDARLAYRTFLHGIERATGKPRDPSQTPRDYLEGLTGRLGSQTETALALNERLEAALFAREEPSAEAVRALDADVRAFRTVLKGAVPAA